jgi:hypothetical protein
MFSLRLLQFISANLLFKSLASDHEHANLHHKHELLFVSWGFICKGNTSCCIFKEKISTLGVEA